MKLDGLNYLFLNDRQDNVATALTAFKAGSVVPVITSDGQAIGEVKLRTQVPIYFKVNIRDLADGEPIIKLGAPIGITVAQVVSHPADAGKSAVETLIITPGTPIHDTNLIFSRGLWESWMMGTSMYEAIAELQFVSRQAPFKLGKAVRNINVDNDIRLSDIEIHEALRLRLFDTLNLGDETVIGRAICKIPVHSYLRAGCCIEKKYALPVRQENIDALRAAYRHSKRLAL
jgi:hypothetical protein